VKGSVQLKLNRFIEYFEARVEFLKSKCEDRIEGYILACCYLDSLAGYRYGGQSNFARFRKFLIESTDQADVWRRVSLILLRHYVESKDNPIFQGLAGLLAKLGAIETNFINLSFNPDIALESLLTKCSEELSPSEIQTHMSDIRRFEYAAILWQAYRNAVVHETAVGIKQALNLADRDTPFYSNENVVSGNTITGLYTRFDIPSSFLIATIESGLRRLRCDVEGGNCTLEFSASYDHPPFHMGIHSGKEEGKEIGYPRLITKPSRSFLRDSGTLLDEARKSHDLYISTNDGEHRWRECAMSRSCIVASVFFLESILASVVDDFRKREPYQLPEGVLKKTGLLHTAYDRLPLIERLYITPYLCSDSHGSLVRGFFDRGASEFQRLKELIEIRGGLAHGRPTRRKLEIMTNGKREHTFDDQFAQNFWPLTKIPKDIFIIDHTHAETAKEIVDTIVMRLDEYLGTRIVRDNWLTSEKIQFDPAKTPESS